MSIENELRSFLEPYKNDDGLPIIPKKDWIKFRSDYEPLLLKGLINKYFESKKKLWF